MQRHRDRFCERTAIRWAIVPTGSAESVGTVGLTITSEEQRIAELGIVVGRSHWGRGVGTSAARLVAGYGFNTLGLSEIRAEVLERNLASVRLLEKVGFRRVRAVSDEVAPDPDACFLYALAGPRS